HKPSTVLSQGEQRIIALADFLAEALMRPSGAPLVFDDPVCGLDRSHAGHLATRLAELSVRRQVIVFTHDIWFVGELLGRVGPDRDRYTHYSIVDQPEAGVILKASENGLEGTQALASAARAS
ncbi:MAG: AAA family ATPase, partial [Solirubrobacteraceae bacterium]